MKICSYVLSSGLDIYNIVGRLADNFRKTLVNYNISSTWYGVINEDEDIPECDVSIFLIGGGGTEELIIESVNRSKVGLIIYHSSNNSLPALLEALPLLKGVYLYEDLSRLDMKLIKAIQGLYSFLSSRIGLIGNVSKWLVYSRVDPGLLESKYGIKLVKIDMKELDNYSDEDLDQVLMGHIIKNAVDIYVNESDIAKAVKLYRRLVKIIEKYNLDTFTIDCFKLLESHGLTPCLPLSILNRDGIIGGCEGDVPSLLGMLLGYKVTGMDVFMGNPSIIDEDYIVLSHCTAPLYKPYKLYTHFESNKGVAVSRIYGSWTPVTLLRLDFNRFRARIGFGVVGENVNYEWLCRTQVKIYLNNARSILDDSIGNHYIMIRGDHTKILPKVLTSLGFKVEWI